MDISRLCNKLRHFSCLQFMHCWLCQCSIVIILLFFLNVEDIHEFYHVPVTQWEWDLRYVYLMSSIKIYDSITLKNETEKGEEWKVFRFFFFFVRLPVWRKIKSVCFLRTYTKKGRQPTFLYITSQVVTFKLRMCLYDT